MARVHGDHFCRHIVSITVNTEFTGVCTTPGTKDFRAYFCAGTQQKRQVQHLVKVKKRSVFTKAG